MKRLVLAAAAAALAASLTGCGSDNVPKGFPAAVQDGTAKVYAVGQAADITQPDGVTRGTWTLLSVSQRAPSRHSYLKPTYSPRYTVLKFNVAVTQGTWSVNPYSFTAVPDADTGTPEYGTALADGMGDSDIYSGEVPAGKHVRGDIFFDIPPGDYTVSLVEGDIYVGIAPVADWRVTVPGTLRGD